MTSTQTPLIGWLDHLKQLTPPQHVVLVGAGNGNGPWVQWLMGRDPGKVTLIEGDDAPFAALQAATAQYAGWQCRQLVVAADAGTQIFHTNSVAAESGLLAPEALQALWPNLTIRKTQLRETVALGAVLSPPDGEHGHWLVIDCWPAWPLLQGLDRAALQALDVVVLRTWLGGNEPNALGQPDLAEAAHALGFKVLETASGRHPAVGHTLIWRDRQPTMASVLANVAEWKHKSDEVVARLATAELTASALETQLAQQRTASETAKAEIAALTSQAKVQTTQAQQLAAALNVAEHVNTKHEQELAQAQAATHTAAHVQELEARLEVMCSQLHDTHELLAHGLKAVQDSAQAQAAQTTALIQQAKAPGIQEQLLRQLASQQSALKDVEAHMLERFDTALAAHQAQQPDILTDMKRMEAAHSAHLQRVEAQLGEMNTKLQATSNNLVERLAQQLPKQQESLKEAEGRLRNDFNKGMANSVQQIEAYVGIQNFMATGESLTNFHGWPISPDIGLFLLERMQSRSYDLIIEFGSGTSTLLFAKALVVQARTRGEPESWKAHLLSRRVLTLEHDLNYHESTRQLLAANGVSDSVELVHTPLVDWHDDNGTYLYYDCDAVLQKVAAALGPEKARILVLVDGPPGATCANARYPAVPHVFNRLARHHIDVVLDDAGRPEEKAVIELWRQFWRKRGIRVEEATAVSEKGIYEARC